MAITFGNTGGSSGSASFALSNNGNYLLVSVAETANTLTAVSYNSVAMTQIGTTVNNVISGRFISLWGLANAAQGSNTLALTGGANQDVNYASLQGVDTTNPVTGATTNTGTSTTPSVAVTTTVDNAYAIAIGFIRDYVSVGANTSILYNGLDPNDALYRSTNPVTPAGSFTINVNSTGSEWSFVAAGFNPAPATTGNKNLPLLGVG